MAGSYICMFRWGNDRFDTVWMNRLRKEHFLTDCIDERPQFQFIITGGMKLLPREWRNALKNTDLCVCVSCLGNILFQFRVSGHEIIVDWGRRRCARRIICKFSTYNQIVLLHNHFRQGRRLEFSSQSIEYIIETTTSSSTSRNQTAGVASYRRQGRINLFTLKSGIQSR
jgi:hypothetical protein